MVRLVYHNFPEFAPFLFPPHEDAPAAQVFPRFYAQLLDKTQIFVYTI